MIDAINTNKIIEFIFLALYLIAIAIIAKTDKEKRQINRGAIYYAIGISILYIIYLCVTDKSNIYRYILYLSITLILLVIDTLDLKNKAKTSYLTSILILLTIMAVFTGEVTTILTSMMTLIIIGLVMLLNKIRKNNEEISNDLTIGFYLCVSNIFILLCLIIKFGVSS